MAALLVTYDLNRPGQDYSGLLNEIKKYSWARLSESSYAINTTQTPSALFDQLRPHMDQNDYLYIITLNKPHRGYGLPNVNDWLDSNL